MFFSFKYEIRFQQKLITKISTVLFQKYLNMDVDLILLRKKNELTRNLNSEVNSYVKFYVQPLYQLINEVLKMYHEVAVRDRYSTQLNHNKTNNREKHQPLSRLLNEPSDRF